MDGRLKDILDNNQVDLVNTMARFMNNDELFTKFLYKFLDDENLAQIGECLDRNDYEQAFKHAHALKGVSSNLGVESVNKPLGTLVERLRAKEYGNDLDGVYQTVVENFIKLKTELLDYKK